MHGKLSKVNKINNDRLTINQLPESSNRPGLNLDDILVVVHSCLSVNRKGEHVKYSPSSV